MNRSARKASKPSKKSKHHRKGGRNIQLVYDADHIENLPNNNNRGPQLKKTWTTHDLNSVKPITKNQKKALEYYQQGYNLVLAGCAGTGKSFFALCLFLADLLQDDSTYEKMHIMRSIVPTRDIGFLKGDEKEKVEAYETVYIDLFDELFKFKKAYANLKEFKKVHFTPTSFIRGASLNNSLMLVDEFSNFNFHELDSTITRVGRNSRIIFSGDVAQSDLIYKKNDTSGFVPFMEILEKVPEEFKIIEFDEDDIVRSDLVKAYLIAKNRL